MSHFMCTYSLNIVHGMVEIFFLNIVVSLFWHQLVKYLKMSKMKSFESANRVGPDEVAHNEPPHVDLPCLPCIL